MKIKDIPIFKTKVDGLTDTFDLSDPAERKKYFEAKAGKEIAALKKYFENNSFIAYLLGKKNAGKGTYTKLMAEIFGSDLIGHISVGDTVREAHKEIEDEETKEDLLNYLKDNYRGYISLDDAIDALLGRSASALLPTEFILTLIKRKIDSMSRKSLFVDGFPRDLDQISYSLYFRDLINYRSDPDVFIGISIPNSVIDERIKYRVICPTCQTPRNIKLFATKEVGYDKETDTFYLKCDDPNCSTPGIRMVGKEGDDLGIEPIKERLALDEKLIDKAFDLHGVPKVLLRNSVPVDTASDYVDQYEITPAYSYELSDDGTVSTIESPWTVKDNEGEEVYSLLAPPVVVSLIKQLVKVLNIEI